MPREVAEERRLNRGQRHRRFHRDDLAANMDDKIADGDRKLRTERSAKPTDQSVQTCLKFPLVTEDSDVVVGSRSERFDPITLVLTRHHENRCAAT